MKKHVVAYARDCWFRFDFRFFVLACCDVEETSHGKEPLSVKDGIPRNRSSESAVPTQHRSALSCRAGKTKRTALRESIVANVPAPFQCRLERTKPRERERERSVLVFFSLKGEKNARKREIFSQPFFAGVLGAVVRSRRGDDIVVFSVRAVLLLLMPMPMLVSSSSSSPSRALLSLMTLTPLCKYFWIERCKKESQMHCLCNRRRGNSL